MTAEIPLTPEQQALIANPPRARFFLEGAAGSGKTTVGVHRLLNGIHSGVAAESFLVLLPQRTLGLPYYEILRRHDLPPGGSASIMTLGGLARRMTTLFWQLAAEEAGFAHPARPPVFLTLETSQYYMARLVEPLLHEGCFDSVSIDPNRLFSQILDNLNKAAANGIAHTDFGERLKSAWVGDPSQHRIYEDAQNCAIRFRDYCLQHNLLDFSLQLEIFANHLWQTRLCRDFLQQQYRHLIYDNIEEDIPLAHDLIRQWLPSFDSALLIQDNDGGFRVFLGADPRNAHLLKDACEESIELGASHVTPPALRQFQVSLSQAITHQNISSPEQAAPAVRVSYHRFTTQMADWVCGQIAEMVNGAGVPPGEIAILTPYLSDALRFSLINRLEALAIPAQSHRPSRSLQDEPAAQCLTTLARLANPAWNLPVSRQDLRYALMSAIQDIDLVRADLLARITYNENKPQAGLSSFDLIRPEMQERITHTLGARFETLRLWIEDYRQSGDEVLDIFFSRIFGELLSQSGFGFHARFDSASVAARLIESAQKFRWGTADISLPGETPAGREYLQMVAAGVVAAQSLPAWEEMSGKAVLLSPAYTFLMANRPVSYQFWLDVGSNGWWERLYQPLTHPYVLSRHWQPGTPWTDQHEYARNQETLSRLTCGLIARCRRQVILCINGMNEQGDEPRGALLQAIQALLRRFPATVEGSDV